MVRSAISGVGVLLLAGLGGCAAAPAWNAAAPATFAAAKGEGRQLAVFFALPGREQSDRMDAAVLRDPLVLTALARGDFASLWLDANTHGRLFREWIGGGEGMGLCVLDGDGRVVAARPGPQDAPEFAAFLDQVAAARPAIAAARRDLEASPGSAAATYRLGVQLLELGCRRETESLLVTAAQRGVVDAHHRLARLYALDGDLVRARQWLQSALPSLECEVTAGYVLFKERRHQDAIAKFERVLAAGLAGRDALRARLYLGKSLHEAGRDVEAKKVLETLIADGGDATFVAAAQHTLGHLQESKHDHSH